MDILDHYRRAQQGFDTLVASVPAQRWDDPSACTEWTNRDVLGHVVWGQEFVRHLATEQTYTCQLGAPGAPHPGVLITGDPVAVWRTAQRSSTASLNAEALARTVELRAFGKVPLAGFLTALVTDFLAHTWDIGQPLGLPVRFEPSVLTGAFTWSRGQTFRAPGGIGPELTPPSGADEQTRFLAYLGRCATPVPA